ncbi:uncharacterized protein LOC113208356 [Frankliniella occidentalis]|uniref:Uncharacterized protein LOC113208356 n=1 Tax=Frankliniella occidentalis TaxID=133901 RepID=A0A6J1SP36_FRAOC|nr:uncharacterized protein LOC113208356 [Frankliniella occidentalis]
MLPPTLVVLALMSHSGILGKAINSIMGPYIFYLERMYACEPQKQALPWRWYFRTTRFNPYKPREPQLLTGNMTGDAAVDDSCSGKIKAAVWSNNQWKENAFVFAFKNRVCTSLKENVPSVWDLFFKSREEKGDVGCTIKTGFYEYDNVPLRLVFPKVPVLTYGRYRVTVTASKAGDLYHCMEAEGRVTPKVN